MNDTVQNIKQEFFALRNGMLADSLRKSGDPHNMIFGLLVAQIKEVAARHTPDAALAQALWNCPTNRECRMLAPYLFPCDEMTEETALQWCNNVETTEIADILCIALLRKLPFANDLVSRTIDSENELVAYLGYRLALNLQIIAKLRNEQEIIAKAEALLPCANLQLKPILTSLLQP